MKTGARLLLAAALAAPLVAATPVAAHEVRPGYLELREADPRDFSVLWRVPARGERRLSLDPVFPEGCSRGPDGIAWMTEGAYVERFRIACDGGLYGGAVRIAGLEGVLTDVIARVERADGTTQVARLTPDSPSFEVVASSSMADVAASYVGLGVEHILFGVDHLLFVLGLLFLAAGWRRLLATVTAFTVAHSLTLALATLGVVHVPGAPVEAVIALSIVFVAAEILHTRGGRPGLAASRPWLVAFGFGLLHGLGFAGALSELGLPEHAVPLALLCFNFGVEIGQVLFVAAVFAVVRLGGSAFLARFASRPAESALATPLAYAVGSLSSFWVLERTAAFWG